MQKSSIDLSIIIVSFNTKEITLSCIKSVKEYTTNIKYEIILVDNDSKDGSVEAAEKLGIRTIRNKENVGFATANNQGIKVSNGEFVLFLNSDTLVEDNVLGEMVDWMRMNPEVGVVTSALMNKDRSLQATGGYFPNLLRVFSWMTIQDFPLVDKFIKPFHPYHSKSFFSKGDSFYDNKKEIDWVTGAFLMTTKKVLQKVGGWDESFFMYVEEVDLCYRIQKMGFKIWYLPKWKIIHLGGASSKISEFALISEYQGIKKLYEKHFAYWQYVLLRIFLKIGALGRIVVFGILDGAKGIKTYAKAFKSI